MRRSFLIVPLFFLFISLPHLSLAQNTTDANKSPQTITLRDGTVIQGNLVSVNGDSYTIENSVMGKVIVPSSKVLSINAAGAGSSSPAILSTMAAPQAGGLASMPKLNAMQTSILQDPQIMGIIQDLMKDPAVIELLKDPSLMQDALTMDPNKIKENPNIQALMQNPKMQEAMKAAAEKMMNSGNNQAIPTTFPQNPQQNQ